MVEQPERATIPVKGSTKGEAERLKREGLTWDAFVQDLLEAWEER